MKARETYVSAIDAMDPEIARAFVRKVTTILWPNGNADHEWSTATIDAIAIACSEIGGRPPEAAYLQVREIVNAAGYAESETHPDWTLADSDIQSRYVYVARNHPCNPSGGTLWFYGHDTIEAAARNASGDSREGDWLPIGIVDRERGTFRECLAPTIAFAPEATPEATPACTACGSTHTTDQGERNGYDRYCLECGSGFDVPEVHS